MTTRHSKQRDKILENLCSRCDHPTAEELYADLKVNMPNLSLGTLYRNLALLAENGTVQKFHCGSSDRFDGNVHRHYHLLCDRCGRLIDLEHEPVPDLDDDFRQNFEGRIRTHHITFYGLCPQCQAAETEK
ncbi:MAG TPA: transcriptional repressor [Ruminococcaceae bacterium]|nr:transcriptional repressor [Oscillospiraceae bacterium]